MVRPLAAGATLVHRTFEAAPSRDPRSMLRFTKQRAATKAPANPRGVVLDRARDAPRGSIGRLPTRSEHAADKLACPTPPWNATEPDASASRPYCTASFSLASIREPFGSIDSGWTNAFEAIDAP